MQPPPPKRSRCQTLEPRDRGSDGKVSVYNARDLGSIPGSGRFSGEGNGNALQYSCLENSMDGGAWWATVCGAAKSWTRLSDFTHFNMYNPTTIFLVALGLFCVGLFLLLCFLPREVPLVFVVKLVRWC